MSTTKFKLESGMQLLARLIKKTEIGNFCPLLFRMCPNNGDIIEISCESGMPLVIDFISEILVSHKLHGRETGIIYFDTDGNFNYDLLFNAMRRKILSHSENQDNNMTADLNVEGMLHETLHNFHIFEINDATQLYTSIHKLENILMEHPNISIIVFDTLTAYYWSEQGFKITRMDSYIKNLLQVIQKVTKEYKITCIYTKPPHFNSNKNDDHIESWLAETIKYRIQIIKSENDFEVNVKTNEMEYMKHFQITDGEIKWL